MHYRFHIRNDNKTSSLSYKWLQYRVKLKYDEYKLKCINMTLVYLIFGITAVVSLDNQIAL